MKIGILSRKATLYSTNRLKIKLKNFEHLEDLIVSREKTSDFKQWLDR